MAKWKPSTVPIANKVENGVLYSTAGSNSAVMRQSNNNRTPGSTTGISKGGTNTSQFSAMDALVSSLDAQYEMLPDKTPWVNYAANIDGNWQLCASCQPDSSGKKLFRQYNFNRSILGLSTVTVPIDDTEFAADLGLDATWQQFQFVPGSYVLPVAHPNTDSTFLIAQIGKNLGNPILEWKSAYDSIFNYSGPAYDWLTSISLFLAGPFPDFGSDFVTWPYCTSTANGAPGLKSICSLLRSRET